MPGVPIGLKDLHYALLVQDDENGVSYQTPVKITGAITANINPNTTIESLFADDGPMETASSLGQIELELVAADFPLDVQATLLGHTVVNGRLVRKASDVPPWVAIGFRSLKSNGKYRYVWLLKGKFYVPEMNHETKSDTINFQTPTMNAAFVKRDYDDAWIHQTDEDMTDYTPAIGDNWFNQVDPTDDTAAPTIESVTPIDGATSVAVDTTVQWVFSEAIRTSDVTSGNFFLMADDGTVVDATLSISADKTTVTLTPAFNLSSATTYQAVVTEDVRDLAGNRLAATSVTTFTTA